jgi:hypothetical protein
MVKCDKCNKKLGFFERRYDYKDSNDNPIIYCENCDKQWVKEQQNKQKELKKKEKELKSKVLSMINNFIDTLDEDKQIQLLGISKNQKPFLMLQDQSLSTLRNYLHNEINTGYQAARLGWVDYLGTGYNPADHIDGFETCLLLLNDIEKAKKIIDKEINYKLSYKKFIKWSGEIFDNAHKQHNIIKEKDFENKIKGNKNCPICKKKIKKASNFCKYCGGKL